MNDNYNNKIIIIIIYLLDLYVHHILIYNNRILTILTRTYRFDDLNIFNIKYLNKLKIIHYRDIYQ